MRPPPALDMGDDAGGLRRLGLHWLSSRQSGRRDLTRQIGWLSSASPTAAWRPRPKGAAGWRERRNRSRGARGSRHKPAFGPDKAQRAGRAEFLEDDAADIALRPLRDDRRGREHGHLSRNRRPPRPAPRSASTAACSGRSLKRGTASSPLRLAEVFEPRHPERSLPPKTVLAAGCLRGKAWRRRR
jgi:hypothetical protein